MPHVYNTSASSIRSRAFQRIARRMPFSRYFSYLQRLLLVLRWSPYNGRFYFSGNTLWKRNCQKFSQILTMLEYVLCNLDLLSSLQYFCSLFDTKLSHNLIQRHHPIIFGHRLTQNLNQTQTWYHQPVSGYHLKIFPVPGRLITSNRLEVELSWTFSEFLEFSTCPIQILLSMPTIQNNSGHRASRS